MNMPELIKAPRPIAVRIILTLNIIVFVLWNFSSADEPTFMIENFLVSWTAITEGRIWTLVTSVFSHNLFLHILINMYAFYGFGSVLEIVLGVRAFVLFYLLAGIAGSLGHSLVCALLLDQPDLPALGASGAISGVILVFSLMFPKQKILLFGLIPLPAIWGAVLLVGLDLWGLIAQTQGSTLPIGYGAHLGGAATGVVYFFTFLSKRKTRTALS